MKPDDFWEWLAATNRSAPEYEEIKRQVKTHYAENVEEEESDFENDPEEKDGTGDEDENKGGSTQKDTSDEESEEKETTDGVAGDDRAPGHNFGGRRHEVEIHNNTVPIKRFGNGAIYQLQAPQEQQGDRDIASDGQKDEETHEDTEAEEEEEKE